jgi:hypothetical protein
VSNMIRRSLALCLLLLGCGLCFQVWAACDVYEVIEMIDDGESRSDIRDACDNKISDAPCSVGKVYKLYDNDGMDEDEIIEDCQGGGGGDEMEDDGDRDDYDDRDDDDSLRDRFEDNADDMDDAIDDVFD